MAPSLRFSTSWTVVVLALGAVACGNGETKPPVAAPKLTAEDAILQVSERYSATSDGRRLLSEPSPIAIHQRRIVSTLSLSRANRVERMSLAERYEYRNGQVTECLADVTRPLQASFEFEQGEATTTLVAAPVRIDYRCTAGAPKELAQQLDSTSLKLVLRDESLVVVAPATDRRRFLPAE